MTDKKEKRKTLSLKIDVNSKHPLKNSNKLGSNDVKNVFGSRSGISNGNSNFGIEIKKRRKRGLNIDVDKNEKNHSNDKKNGNISSKLTDTEFKVRVKVLQEALNKEQNEKHNNYNDVDRNNNEYNINSNLDENSNRFSNNSNFISKENNNNDSQYSEQERKQFDEIDINTINDNLSKNKAKNKLINNKQSEEYINSNKEEDFSNNTQSTTYTNENYIDNLKNKNNGMQNKNCISNLNNSNNEDEDYPKNENRAQNRNNENISSYNKDKNNNYADRWTSKNNESKVFKKEEVYEPVQPVIFRASEFNKSSKLLKEKSYNRDSNKYSERKPRFSRDMDRNYRSESSDDRQYRYSRDGNSNKERPRFNETGEKYNKEINNEERYSRFSKRENNNEERFSRFNGREKNNEEGYNKFSRNGERQSRFGDKSQRESFNRQSERLNKDQKQKKWNDRNNEKDKIKYNKEDLTQKTYKKSDIDPNSIPLNKNNNTKTTSKSKSKFNNDNDNKKKNSSNSQYTNTSKKITRVALDRAMNDESEERMRSLASTKRAILKSKNADKPKQEQGRIVREVLIPDNITVGELANRMAVKASEVVKYLMSVGTMATINQLIDDETAEIVCTSFGHIAKKVSDNNDVDLDFRDIDNNAELIQRAPIVAVMGHVDHGKTTLLDTLRKSSVAQKEAGGITQHVAAYQVETKNGKKITFIDTPGHAAFTSIRARGAKLTDIIVLVVAADDGIKEQTIEVIKQAQSQNVPIVVAINKIDKQNINVNKVKTDLMNYDIVLEEFGGETLSCEISAKNNINLDKLLETILLQSEICDLKANPNRNANGTILEARVDKGRGIVSSVIVQGGTMKNGDIFVAGSTFGKVRAMYNSAGQKVNNIIPSTPIELIGFDSAPEPGDTIIVVESEQKAREIAEKRKANKKNSKANKISIKSINQVMEQESMKVLNVFAKADVYGSLEAIIASLEAIKHPEIMVKVIGKDIGIISESDIDFAIPSNAVVIGFNVNSTATAKELSKVNNIKILNHNVIYHLIEEIKSIMSSMLDPIIEEQYIGTADVKKLFIISRLGTIAGCYVSDGIIKRNNSKIKLMRNGKCVFEGKIKSMKHEKDEIKESKQNHECGILADGYNDFQEGDKIECYEIIQKARTID